MIHIIAMIKMMNDTKVSILFFMKFNETQYNDRNRFHFEFLQVFQMSGLYGVTKRRVTRTIHIHSIYRTHTISYWF